MLVKIFGFFIYFVVLIYQGIQNFQRFVFSPTDYLVPCFTQLCSANAHADLVFLVLWHTGSRHK